MCGDLQQSILELETMRKYHPFLEHSLLVALIYFHSINDKEFIKLDQTKYNQLQKTVTAASEHIDTEGVMLTAEFDMMISENNQEVESCLNILSTRDLSKSQQERYQLLKAWYKILSSSKVMVNDDIFCTLLNNVTNDISNCNVDTLMVLSR